MRQGFFYSGLAMTDIVNNATIRVVADASGVEAGLRPAIDAAQRAGQAITQSGASAAGAARSVEYAQRNIIASIQRTTMAMESGGRTTAAYYEAQARQRNVDPAALTPYLNQLRAVEAAQTQATESTRARPRPTRNPFWPACASRLHYSASRLKRSCDTARPRPVHRRKPPS
jgi:hypothetical protein